MGGLLRVQIRSLVPMSCHALSEVSRLAIPKAGQNSSYALDCTDPTG
jgi:hypothetical protein